MSKVNEWMKFLVSLLGPAWAMYQAYQPTGANGKWSVAVAALISSLLVGLVPNQKSEPKPVQPPASSPKAQTDRPIDPTAVVVVKPSVTGRDNPGPVPADHPAVRGSENVW